MKKPVFPVEFKLCDSFIEFQAVLDHGVITVTEEMIQTVQLFFVHCPELTEGTWQGNEVDSRVAFTPHLEYEEAIALADRLGIDF